MDEDGGVWIAVLGAGTVERFTATGQHDVILDVSPTLVTSIAFGGTDHRALYITTGRDDRGIGGSLLATTTTVPGVAHTPATV